jgi:hypothetical protein
MYYYYYFDDVLYLAQVPIMVLSCSNMYRSLIVIINFQIRWIRMGDGSVINIPASQKNMGRSIEILPYYSGTVNKKCRCI